MKNIFKLILIFFFVCKVSNAEQSRVIDGDTIIYNGQKIRLFGIDAPEKKQKCKKPFLSLSFISFSKEYDCGLLATKKLKQKIDKKIINCIKKGTDRYQRIIGICYINNRDINAWMVRNGYAVAYVKYSKKYLFQENLARKENLGIWNGEFQMPWDWRRANK